MQTPMQCLQAPQRSQQTKPQKKTTKAPESSPEEMKMHRILNKYFKIVIIKNLNVLECGGTYL
jgi:hypothetical protein